MKDRTHIRRIRQELRQVGATIYGLNKSESRYLPHIIHEAEHIGGVVYGQHGSSSAMLIATNKRVIFLDCKLMVTLSDELTYDAISGVEFDVHTLFATVILQTRVGNYIVRFANIKCATGFSDYIEKRRLDTNNILNHKKTALPVSIINKHVSTGGLKFLLERGVGVLSTVDRTGNVHGATVYYTVYNDYIYVLSKSDTHKTHNILAHNQVSLTVSDTDTLQTLQLNGLAEVETNRTVKDYIFNEMVKPRSHKGRELLPPVVKLEAGAGAYVIIRIAPISSNFSDYL